MRGRGRWTIGLVAAGIAVAAAVVTAVLVIGASDDDETTSVAIRSNSLVLIDPEEDRVVDAVALNGTPTRLTYGEGAFWVAAPDVGFVVRVDEETRAVSRFRVGEEPYDVAVGAGAVWVPDHDLHRLLRVDAETGAVRQSSDFGAPAVAVGYGFDAVWVVVVPGALMRIDPETLQATKMVTGVAETTELAEPKLVFGDDALWIASPANGKLTRVDPAGRGKTTQDIDGISSAAAEGDAVWVADEGGYVSRLEGGTPERIRVGDIPVDVAASDGALWAAAYEKAVKRLDISDRRVAATIKLPDRPVAIVAGDTFVAVAVGESPF